MSGFDAYHRWLGIPPEQQPPNYYRLLGLELFESDPDVIREGAERQIAHIRRAAIGKHQRDAQQLLDELGRAKACLLNNNRRASYDSGLEQTHAETPASSTTPSEGFPPPSVPPASAAIGSTKKNGSRALLLVIPLLIVLAVAASSAVRALMPVRKSPQEEESVPQIPVLVGSYNLHAAVGSPLEHQVRPVKPELWTDKLEYRLRQGGEGASINPNTGLLTWLPSESGNFDFVVEAAVVEQPDITTSCEITIDVKEVGQRRIFRSDLDTVEVMVGDTMVLPTVARDIDLAGLAFRALQELPSDLSLNQATGVITWRPSHEFELAEVEVSLQAIHRDTVDGKELLMDRIDVTIGVGSSRQPRPDPRFLAPTIIETRAACGPIVSEYAATKSTRWHEDEHAEGVFPFLLRGASGILERPPALPGVRGAYYVEISASIPLRRQHAEYLAAFQDAAGFDAARDSPRYIGWELQRRKHSSVEYSPNWTTIERGPLSGIVDERFEQHVDPFHRTWELAIDCRNTLIRPNRVSPALARVDPERLDANRNDISPDLLFLRLIDQTVEQSSHYQYRLRMSLVDANSLAHQDAPARHFLSADVLRRMELQTNERQGLETPFSAPSSVVTIPNEANLGLSETTPPVHFHYKGVQLRRPYSEPSALLLVSEFDVATATYTSSELVVRRGNVIDFSTEDYLVLDPWKGRSALRGDGNTRYERRRAQGPYQFGIDTMVVDIRAGNSLEDSVERILADGKEGKGTRASRILPSPASVLVLEPTGALRVVSDLDDSNKRHIDRTISAREGVRYAMEVWRESDWGKEERLTRALAAALNQAQLAEVSIRSGSNLANLCRLRCWLAGIETNNRDSFPRVRFEAVKVKGRSRESQIVLELSENSKKVIEASREGFYREG